MSEAYSFGVAPVPVHAWNGDRTEVALSMNDNDVKLFKKKGPMYLPSETLSEHGQRVTGIDWGSKKNRIVTCGADRNALVWELGSDNKWKPHLVILRINRAATCVRWSPEENKFAVGSGARIISVCYYEDENNWWVSKHIKKPIRSTVTSLDWHPNNILLAAGSTDFKARIFSAYVKEVEAKPSPTSWGSKMPFGQLMVEHSNGGGGWVHDVSFSPSGEKLAWVGHDASVTVATSTGDQLACVKGNFLPFMSLTWVTENSFVCGGNDCNPKLFTHSDDEKVTFISDLDIPQEKAQMQMSAMDRFRGMDKKGTAEGSSGDLKTKHQNTISQVTVFQGSKADCTKLSTSGVDGQLIIWDIKSLEKQISGLRIS